MIRVKVQRCGEATRIREYADAAEAAKWLIEDSYFMNDDVLMIVWENRPDCDHMWIPAGSDTSYVHLVCDHGCGRDIKFEHSTLTRIARIKQR